MITANTDIFDGQVNGTCGILKKIEKDSQSQYAITLWFDFFDLDIGRIARAKNYNKYRNNNNTIDLDRWTPIFRGEATLKISKTATWSIIRKQFQIVECEALTVHKSQGQTYQAIGFEIIQINLTRASLYVALSRITKLEQLYLFGASSIVEGQKFLRYNKHKKAQEIKKLMKSDIQLEKARLREDVPFDNRFPFLDIIQNEQLVINNNNSLNIFFHNVAGLNAHLPYIKADFATQQADILLLVECHTNPKDKDRYKIDGFQLLNLSGAKHLNASNGIACYVKDKYVNYVRVFSNSSKDGLYKNSNDLEITLVYLKLQKHKTYIISLYKHPNQTFKDFWQTFKEFMRANIPDVENQDCQTNVFILGDFNIDAIKEAQVKDKILNKFNLKFINPNGHTTDRKTTIDWCLTNTKTLQHVTYIYESYYSDHKPLWLSIKRTL